MVNFFKIFIGYFLLLIISCSGLKNGEGSDYIQSPEVLYGKLFYDVQSSEHIFSDSKTFVDCVPLFDVKTINKRYTEINPQTDQAKLEFIKSHFKLPLDETKYVTDSSEIKTHIFRLWDVLKRPADKVNTGTLIPLPYTYIVPGGRFREIYYWDSYFTMLGLQEDNQTKVIQNLVDNFSYLIDEFGFIPNGNRTYYLSRSQPPFYALMLNILAESKGEKVYVNHLNTLLTEYNFWMDGSGKLNTKSRSEKRVVRMKYGEVLNRYWDSNNTPRPESYLEDTKTAKMALAHNPAVKAEDVYRNLRAAAESGWDFSSRWIDKEEGKYPLYNIHTTDIIPVDLNCLMYNMELTIAKCYKLIGDQNNKDLFNQKANLRLNAINKYFWNPQKGFYFDLDLRNNLHTPVYSLAGAYPLFFNIADKDQAQKCKINLEFKFLCPGGLVTTLNETSQQWDAPNGWAPLQWISIKGLKNYGYDTLASTIANRWKRLNEDVYKETYKMLEKYNVKDLNKKGGGGEYPNQDGFGWTNGVYRKLSSENF